MSVSARVRKDDHLDEYHKNCLIRKKGKHVVIYADAGGYSQTSGQNIIKGKAKRGVDGTILKFKSIEQAVKWLDAGEPVFVIGRELFDEKGHQITNL